MVGCLGWPGRSTKRAIVSELVKGQGYPKNIPRMDNYNSLMVRQDASMFTIREEFYQEIIDIYRDKVWISKAEYEKLQEKWLASGETEPLGAGYSRIWFTGYSDSFLPAAVCHDIEYSRLDLPSGRPVRVVDREFHEHCLRIADYYHSLWLRIRAHVYCGIVRAWSLLT